MKGTDGRSSGWGTQEAPFGARLRRFRGARLTQEELASRTSLIARGISDLERG